MPEKPRERFVRFSLITGEETYAAQGSQNPETSRRLKSLLPSLAGDLKRERPHPKYLTTLLPAAVGWLWQFDKKASDGSFTSHFFAATSTKLYHQESGAWVEVTAVGTLVGYPQAVNLNNLMHFTDGAANWIFDGTNWVQEGLAIPVTKPILINCAFHKPRRAANASGASWIYLSAATRDNDVYAEYNDTTQTDLVVNNFFSLAAVSTFLDSSLDGVLGIEVIVRGRGASGTATERQIDVGLTKDGTALAGARKTGQQLAQVEDTVLTLGGPTDLWGTTWTPAEITSVNFGALIRKNTATANLIKIDSIEAKVYLGSGSLDVTTNRYYWYTLEDDTSTIPERVHESSSSPRSLGTGTLVDRRVVVIPFLSRLSTVIGSPVVEALDDTFAFDAAHIGSLIYISAAEAPKKILSVGGATKATDVLTCSLLPTDGETVTIDSRVYTFKDILGAAYQVKIGVDLQTSLANFKAAINKETGEGTKYGTGTAVHSTVSCTASTATTLTIEARQSGVTGNSIVVADTLVNGSWATSALAGAVDSTCTVDSNYTSVQNATAFFIAPARVTHWILYASESENSAVGFRLAKVSLSEAAQLVDRVHYDDESPFAGQPGSLFGPIERPLRNDPPPLSKIMEPHRGRIFRRRETFPNFLNFSAAEEVEAQKAGSPQESVPGADDNTRSDLVNEFSVPDESDVIRALKSHADALYIATEDDILPLYGDSIDNFATALVTPFSVGCVGRYAMESTPYGLVWFGNDRRLWLYPAQSAPSPVAKTDAVIIDVGRPKRDTWLTIKNTDLDNVRVKYYRRQGESDWLVVCFQDNTSVYQTWIYVIEARAWVQLDLGVASVEVFEVAPGQFILAGGGSDGYVYVLDDPFALYSITGLNYPEALFRPALIDFGAPYQQHVPRYLEYEVSDETMVVEARYWLDPVDASNPGEGIQLSTSKVKGSANQFRAFFKGGNLCQRLLVELRVPASIVTGKIRSVAVAAEPASNLAKGYATSG